MFQHRIGHFVLALTALLALGNGLLVGAINVSAGPGVAGVAHSPAQIAPQALAANPALKREVFGFALGSSLSDPTIGYSTWNFSLLTTVAYFGLHVQDDGTFAADSSRTVWNSGQIGALVSSAHAHGARVILTIVLQDFGAGNPHMCSGLSHKSTTVANTVAEVQAKGVDGVNVDYEGLNNSCGTPDTSWARHTMTGFAAALRSALPAGSYLSVDTYAGSASDPIGFYDVAAMAPTVDSFFVMAYDLEYANYRRSPLGCSSFCLSPTAPLNGYYYNDTATAAQYVATVPASKVILGVPYYGRKACVAGATQNQYPTGAATADTYLDASSEGTDPAAQARSYHAERDPDDPAGQARGAGGGATTSPATPTGPPVATSYLTWYDRTSPGVGADNIHLLNSGASASSGCVTVNGKAVMPWTANAGQETFVTMPPGTIGGPVRVTVNSGPAVRASQRVQFNRSFNELWTAPPAQGATTSYFSWYDKASAGMVSDNIHLLNPGGASASVTVTLPGASPQSVTVGAGGGAYVTFPRGTIGGPVTLTSTQPVIASQRVQYNRPFNEVWSQTVAATARHFSWLDN